MRVLVCVVGKRTEHWEGFFAALARNPELEVMVRAADISPIACERLALLAQGSSRLHFRLAPHLVGEDRTGHMASILFRPGSWRALRDFAPDVLHIIGEPSYLATYQAIRFRTRFWPGVPITHYAAQNVVTRFPPPFPWLERYAYGQIALAFPITPTALEVLRRKGYRGDARIVPLGVDRERFRPRSAPPPGPFTIGFVGRLEPHKGILDLTAAAARLDCRLLVVGDGSLRAELDVEAARRPDRIKLVPWVSHEELPALLSRMHALAFPSVEIVQRNVVPWVGIPLREQFGRVLLEAMACGVPIVASDVGEVPYVVGDAGLIVPAHDPEALAGALAELRKRPQLAAQLGRAGIARAARFDWNRIAEEVFEAWSLLARSRGGGRSRLAASA